MLLTTHMKNTIFTQLLRYAMYRLNLNNFTLCNAKKIVVHFSSLSNVLINKESSIY